MRKFTLKRLGGLALLAVVAAVAIAPATALAQDALSNPSASQYEPKSQVQGTSTNGSNAKGSNTSASVPAAANTSASASPASGLNGNVGSLPFTGMDVIVLAVVAAALIGTGVALHRLSAPKAPKA